MNKKEYVKLVNKTKAIKCPGAAALAALFAEAAYNTSTEVSEITTCFGTKEKPTKRMKALPAKVAAAVLKFRAAKEATYTAAIKAVDEILAVKFDEPRKVEAKKVEAKKVEAKKVEAKAPVKK